MSRNRRRSRILPALVATALVATFSACGSDGESAPSEVAASTPSQAAPLDATVAPGTHMITVTGAEPGLELAVVSTDGTQTAAGAVDERGSLLFRGIEPGEYRVVTSDGASTSDVVTVYGPEAVPDASFYSSQVLPAGGFGYLTTRDGTTLSINVALPGPAENGPYPTVVEYSGYAPSNPDDTTFALLFNTLGYAYVGVNMRGTGCSGGSYRFFEEAQLLDGYDAIEAIAAQPWVAGNRVGMVGVSYPGISQLFVASTRPPSLAAITPLSVLDDSYRATLYPGGILNTGFAVAWTEQRMKEAEPFGQPWTKERADGGDEICADNQNVRLQNPDLTALIDANPFYDPALGDEINPALLVGDIEVPVFVAGAWQDEQTGGRFPALLDLFESSPHVYASLVNGLHTESIGPTVFPRFAEFLSLYVAEKVPDLTPATTVAGPLSTAIFGVDTPIDATNRFAGLSFDEALAAFESEPAIQVLFEVGAAEGSPNGAPVARWRAAFDRWPIASATEMRFALDANGRLVRDGSGSGSTDYTADPSATPPTFYAGPSNLIWRADAVFDWVRNPAGTAAVFTTEPLASDVVVIGPSSADLWISSDAVDTDLEVTISEIRPDGSEVYVQSGWLRASHRALDEAASTVVRPVHRHLAADAAELVPGEPTAVRVEIFPVAHPFRAGSRLRVTIDAPGGNRGAWSFDSLSAGERVTVWHDAEHPSSIVFPVVDGLAVPAGVAPCGALRGQPCRAA